MLIGMDWLPWYCICHLVLESFLCNPTNWTSCLSCLSLWISGKVPELTNCVALPSLCHWRGTPSEIFSSWLLSEWSKEKNVVLASRVVLWSFKPGTYQTGSFAELTPKFQTCGMRSHKFWAPSPNDWDPCAAYHFYSGLCQAMWWLTRFDWLSLNGVQSHWHKGMQEVKSSDAFVRALMITVD
jgi:hypothetical protein